MKNNIIINILFFFLLIFTNCAQQDDYSVLKGPYLGQKPPGMKPEIFAPGIVSSGFNEMNITFTPDGGEVFFRRSGPDYFSEMLYMKKVNGKWEGPFMDPFKDIHSIKFLFVNPSGKILYFDTIAGIYFSKKKDNGWSSPILLGSNINTKNREGCVSTAMNGNLYFMADYKNTKGGVDIYMSEYINGEYSKVFHLSDSINSKYNDCHPCISPDEGYIVFDSQRPGGFGRNDLYISFQRKDSTWTKAKNLGEPINTEAYDMRPYITHDGKYLFFSSTRSIPKVSAEDKNLSYDEFMRKITGPGNGSQDIYWVDARIIDKLKPKELK